MPEGSRRGSQRSPSNAAAKRPSSVSSLSGIVGRMMSSGERGASSSSCTSVNTVCSDSGRPPSLSLSSSTSSVSLQDASHSSSSSSSSSLPYGAVPTYNASSSSSSSSTPKRNSSDISLDLTPLLTPHGGGVPGGGANVARVTGRSHAPNGHVANVVASAAATPRQLSRLERVALEIVETEQAYVRDLKSIVEDYLGCIIDCGALPLKPDQVSTLFCNIEDIYEFNSDLLEDLERSPHAAAMAECFVERSEAFDIYTLYCMNYPNSVAVLRECMKNESLVRFFQERQTTLNHSLPLETYLLKPVQRILKYHLLLQELSKHFDKSNPGYEVVEDAIITMTAVAWYINDMKRKQEHAVRLQEIESLLVNWSGPELGGFGELVLEGSFKVQRVKKERAFFLFDKMLLIAKKRLEQFVYSTHIFCCNLLLVETLKDPLCFRVSDQTIPKQQHVVQTKNQEEKRLWVHYLKRLIVENHPASLPQKARQVLGDGFCHSPQLDQEHLKKPAASPRLDDIHSYHRGRRQSEPPELLLYTPEKSRKSLPLLLEGNLPYRRTRRQSAPAKDIEAAFHPNALKQADSDGELCTAESLGSAGSSSTLASSVIEVEAERDEPRLTLQLQTNQVEEEEELSPLSPPPTLSITEEILEFINQSRAREGLATIPTDTSEQIQNPPSESESPSNQTNFTCPLPPVASSPEQSPTMQQEGEEVENNITLHNESSENETTDEVQEVLDATSSVETQGETQAGMDETEEGKEGGDEDDLTISPSPITKLHPSISAEEDIEISKKEIKREVPTSSQHPDLHHHPIQRGPSSTRGPHLTKRDKKIIEKIRSYYEAAAEAEEDEAEEGEDLGEEGFTRRRNSFSQIPSGLVKESVSRFSVERHQGDPESRQGKHEGPSSSSSSLPADADSDGEADKPVSSTDVDAESPIPDVMQDKESPAEADQILRSDLNSLVEEDTEDICKRSAEEEEERKMSVVITGDQDGKSPDGEDPFESKQFKTKEEVKPRSVSGGHETNQESSGPPLSQEQCPKNKQTKAQSTWSRAKIRDLDTSGSLDGLPSQIKVGRWSRHSRTVTDNRALFEGMASDVTGIGFFEANPVVDPSLLENSERILSKVQTLAQMYSAKANSMKVPLHQKRAGSVRNQTWVSARVSGHSQSKTQTQGQSQTRTQQQTETSLSENKSGTETREKSDRASSQNQIQTPTQDERMADDFQKEVESPAGPVTPTCQLQTNGFVLSRPRDFISAMTRDNDSGVACLNGNSQISSFTGETPPPLPRIPSLSQNQTYTTSTETASSESSRNLRTQPESPGSGNVLSTSPVALDGGRSKFSDVYSVPEVPQKTDRVEWDDGCFHSVRDDSTSVNILLLPTEPEPSGSALSIPQRDLSRDGDKDDFPAAQPSQDQLVPGLVFTGHGDDRDVFNSNITEAEAAGEHMMMMVVTSPAEGLTGEQTQTLHLAERAVTTLGTSRSLKFYAEETFDPTEQDQRSRDEASPLSVDLLPTFTSQRPTDLPTTLSKRVSSETWRVNSTAESDRQKPSEPTSECPSSPSTFTPSLMHRSPSPVRALHASSVRATPCSSPFWVIPSPTPVSPAGFTSLTSTSKALSCLSPTLSPIPSMRAQPASSPTPPSYSSSGRSSSSRAGPPSPSTPSIRSPPCSSPVTSSSAFTRSLAASCISQSISQSMVKNNTARQQAPPTNTANQSPSSTPHLRQHSQSPKLPPGQQGTSTPAYFQLGCTKDGYQQPRCPPATLLSSCPSPSLMQPPSPSLSQRSPSPSMSLAHHQPPYSSSASPRPSFLHSKTNSSQYANKNNNNSAGLTRAVSHVNSTSSAFNHGSWSVSPQKVAIANGSTNMAATQPTHNPLWSGSYNRVARPFSASEPSSRVQSPSPSPTPASFARLCSSPPQHNYSSPMANKPPHPRSTRAGGASSHNPLGLSLELPRAFSASSAFGHSSCVSPRILSPPPIGVSVWTNNVATPQPRNPRYASSPHSFSSTLGSPTKEISSLPNSSSYSFVTGSSSLSGSCPPASQTLRRSLSSSLADRPSSPSRSNSCGLRHSWANSSRKSLGFSGSSQVSSDQQESCPVSPRSGWSSERSSPSCLSPRAGLQSPLSPSRFTLSKNSLGGQHFTSVPWPDVQELSSKYNQVHSFETSATSTIITPSSSPMSPSYHTLLTSPVSSDGFTEWGDPELEEGNCRSQLICAYVARPSCETNLSSSCLVFSTSGMTSPPPVPYGHQNLHSQAQRQSQVTTTSPVSSISSPLPSSSSPLPFSLSSPTKQGNQKASYATTVNLQIAGSGRITSFSTAQVSLTQTLQGL
ncbi:pleckstrin homology domain-containing family G member 3 isoform X2 [Melanotaenia boesemani]|uniref:pleckstrin homology domain-containing family G member 3 isoform X2 n=1 Tax=Melanotaenia boesemani TaxID=1250792 RepID=UPI001C0408EA|nr:pleckstrin homology domain-containing family G member 3 isoform X2 [Melanotaenia boesemani]